MHFMDFYSFFSYDGLYMPKIPFTNILVFVVFFGAALIEALWNHQWPLAILFFLLGALSLWVDVRNKN